MWILQGEPVPDHSTIARFQNEKLTGVIEDLFYQLVEKLHEAGEVGFRNIFVDGTKSRQMPADTPSYGRKPLKSTMPGWTQR